MPRDGIEPPTPAFSGRLGDFLVTLKTLRDGNTGLSYDSVGGLFHTLTYNFTHGDFGPRCMEKWQKSAKVFKAPRHNGMTGIDPDDLYRVKVTRRP